jgi:hypothetical protein
MSTLGTFAKFQNKTVASFARKKKEATGVQPVKQYAEGATDLKRQPIYKQGETDLKRPAMYDKGATNVPNKGEMKNLNKLRGQNQVEQSVDNKGFRNSVKAIADKTTAAGGSLERKLMAKAQNSDKGWVKGLAEGAEKAGKAGYQAGATGARGVLNKIAGRTLTGKAVRLGAAGAGIAAIGGAMKRKRQENQ